MMSARLAIVATHPIQYNAPVFRELSTCTGLESRVFYGWRGATTSTLDRGFGQKIEWDLPLLDGYESEFVVNAAKDPGTHHFRGIDLPTLEDRLLAFQPTSVLVYGWCFKAHLQIMRRLKGKVPILFRGDSTLLGERLGVRRILRRGLLRWVYRHVDVALYVGTNNRSYFVKHGVQDSQLAFAPHAVDNQRFASYDRLKAQQLRTELGIGAEETMVLFAGKLETVKAPDQLLHAFLKLPEKRVHLVIAGSGRMEQTLKDVSSNQVHFLGFQNQSLMPHLYGAADLLALPSRSETWGLAINEAMAAGCAILTSNRVGSAVDLVQENKNGWIAEAGNQSSLDQCLRLAVQRGRNPLISMGGHSRVIIRDWSIGAQARSIAEVASRFRQPPYFGVSLSKKSGSFRGQELTSESGLQATPDISGN